jgi:hypothetical protein
MLSITEFSGNMRHDNQIENGDFGLTALSNPQRFLVEHIRKLPAYIIYLL